MTQCEFCDEFSGGRTNSFARRYQHEMPDRTIFATCNFKVIPSLGQIVEGYLLLVPTRHYGTLADMPIVLIKEVAALTNLVREALRHSYGSQCLFFEHGARNVASGGCGIYHAHLHAVPFSESDDPIQVLKRIHQYHEVQSFEDIKSVDHRSSYLYYEDVNSNRHIFDVALLPSQYARQLLARAIGTSKWDWRQYDREGALLSTMTRIAKAITELSPLRPLLADARQDLTP